MKKMYANLHLHSTHSDGVFSPTEMVRMAKYEGYRALAITDHDTVTAYPELKAACEKEELDCIFGAEFTGPSDKYHKIFHIVGFGFDPEYPPLKEYLRQLSATETHQTEVIFRAAVEKGQITGITWEEVLEYNKSITWLCNNHVFRAMQNKGLVKESDYMSFFDTVYRDERAKVPQLYPWKDVTEIIQLILDAGGIPIFAHPIDPLFNFDESIHLEILDYIREAGIKGIEVYHAHQKGEFRDKIEAYAIKHNLIISGGSDHSGICGGYLPSCPDEMDITEFRQYAPLLYSGVTKEQYEFLKSKCKVK